MFAAILLVAGGASAQPLTDAQLESALAPIRARDAALASLVAKVERSVVAVSRFAAPSRPGEPLRAAVEGGQLPDRGPLAAAVVEGQLVIDPFGNIRSLNGQRPEPQAVGAGVAIGPDRVLTQYLVVSPDSRHEITTVEGEVLGATLIGADPRSGLAVLATSADSPRLEPISLGEAERVQKGETVIAISNPQAILKDGQPSASVGAVTNVSAKLADDVNINNAQDGRSRESFRTTLHHFGALLQTDARLGFGSSGGALVNLRGELVGIITSAGVSAGHESAAGYAIPINRAMRRVVGALREGKEAEYGLLGIQFNPLADAQLPRRKGPTEGVAIEVAYPGSPAHAAGLAAGDRIVRIQGEPIDSADRLQLVVQGIGPGAKADVEFLRSGSLQRTSVLLGKAAIQGRQVVTSRPAPWRGIRVDFSTALPAPELQEVAQLGRIDPEGCVLVAEVEKDSPSWLAGVRRGMFISHVGETRVTTPEEFHRATATADDSVNLRFTQPVIPEVEEAEQNQPF